MSGRSRLAIGVLLLLLAGCAGLHDDGLLVPPDTIEPADAPGETTDAEAAEAAARLLSAVIAGDLLVGGEAGTRLLKAPELMPAAEPADETAAVVAAGDAATTAEARRSAAFGRVLASRQGTAEAFLLERWMSSRVAPAPLARADIRRAQQLLVDLGYDPGPIDGFMGPRTRAAVERFQADQGVVASGEITPALIDRLAAEQG
jgi:hypothetical protein